jgi:protein phosphatase methylesterase 1
MSIFSVVLNCLALLNLPEVDLPAIMSARSGGENNLRSSLLKSRIAKLPHLPAIAPSQWSSGADEEQQEEVDNVGSLGMAPPPRSSVQRSAESKSIDALYSPLSAEDCFEEALEVDIGETDNERRAKFRIYYTPPKQASSKKRQDNLGPSETLDSLSLPDTVESSNNDDVAAPGTVFFFHHGAGYSALSYALVAKHLTELSNGEAGVLSFDCRGHGEHFGHTIRNISSTN